MHPNNLAYASIEHSGGEPVVIFCGDQGQAMQEYSFCMEGADPSLTCYSTDYNVSDITEFSQNHDTVCRDCDGLQPVFLYEVCGDCIDSDGYVV